MTNYSKYIREFTNYVRAIEQHNDVEQISAHDKLWEAHAMLSTAESDAAHEFINRMNPQGLRGDWLEMYDRCIAPFFKE